LHLPQTLTHGVRVRLPGRRDDLGFDAIGGGSVRHSRAQDGNGGRGSNSGNETN
jgi:hypothetical protein